MVVTTPLILWFSFIGLTVVGAVSPSQGKLPPPPPPPDKLNTTLVIILAAIGVILFGLLVALVGYVCKLQGDYAKEAKEGADDKKVELLKDERNLREKELLDNVTKQLAQLQNTWEQSKIKNAKFLKEHDPEMFELMKDCGDIRIAGDDDNLEMAARDIDAELRAVGLNPNDPDFSRYRKQQLLDETEETDRVHLLNREMHELKKKREQRRKERALEDEKAALEQRLVNLELQEKLEALRQMEKVQKEQEAIDNLKTSKRLTLAANGDVVISRMGGNLYGFESEPYDADFDFDDRLPELPEHLDTMNERGKILKSKLLESRSFLDAEKQLNNNRETEMERDITLMKLRLKQQKRRNINAERSEGANHETDIRENPKMKSAIEAAAKEVPKYVSSQLM